MKVLRRDAIKLPSFVVTMNLRMRFVLLLGSGVTLSRLVLAAFFIYNRMCFVVSILIHSYNMS